MATSELLFENPDEGILRENLLSVEAEKEVKGFKKFDDRKQREEKGSPSITQLRKFYNDVLTLKSKIEHYDEGKREKHFKQLLPYVKMLKAKVAYAKSKEHVNDEFKEFINKYVDSIKDLDDFYAFCHFFEAIVAYGAYLEEEFKHKKKLNSKRY